MIKKIVAVVVFVVLVFALGIKVENKIRNKFKNLDINKFILTKVDESNLPPTPSLTLLTGGQARRGEIATVKRVIDGDTIELSDGRRVRYIGMNAPEMTDKRAEILCFAKMAKAENQKLVEGKSIEMEKDISDIDKYDRLLRYIWVNNEMVNLTLVKEGLAKTATYPPDVKYKDLFLEAEKQANKIICKGF